LERINQSTFYKIKAWKGLTNQRSGKSKVGKEYPISVLEKSSVGKDEPISVLENEGLERINQSAF
jgi:hypothetical protein